MSRSCDYFRVTKVDTSAHYLTFEWTVKNFQYATSTIYSDLFSFKENCPTKWKLLIEFAKINNYDNYQKRSMCVGLHRVDGKNTIVKVALFFKITNSSGEFYLAQSTESTSSSQSSVCKCSFFEAPSQNAYVRGHNNKEFILRNDNLILIGKVIVEQCCSQSTLDVISPSDNTKQLQTDFKQLWQNSEFVDVEIKVGKDVVPAHKFVLCARSPVFKKMFQNDMKEKAGNSVKITDMNKSVVETFLAFLYTGIVEDKKFETVMALYSAADKYEVKTLQETCRDILVSFINHGTVSVIMKLADAHSDDHLKNIAVDFICQNFAEVESTEHWNNLLDSDPRLASFALKRVSLKLSKK